MFLQIGLWAVGSLVRLVMVYRDSLNDGILGCNNYRGQTSFIIL